jgi:hypothetical protein
MSFVTLIGLEVLMIEGLLQLMLFFLVLVWCHGVPRNNQLSLGLAQNQNTDPWPLSLPSSTSLGCYFVISMFLWFLLPHCGVIIWVPYLLHLIEYTMPAPNT